jgi:hypothetical protein
MATGASFPWQWSITRERIFYQDYDDDYYEDRLPQINDKPLVQFW